MPVLEQRVAGPAKSTRCRVDFFTDPENGFSGSVGYGAFDNLETTFGKIVGVNTSKTFGGAGTFDITVKKPPSWQWVDRGTTSVGSWHRLWRDPEDTWVKITFFVENVPVDTMIGVIDSIKENTSISPRGAVAETYTITGRDFGKAFESTPLFFLFYDNGLALQEQFRGYINALAPIFTRANTPADVMYGLLDLFMGVRGNNYERAWMLPDGLASTARTSLWDWLALDIEEQRKQRDGYVIDIQPLMPDDSRTLWQTMQEFCNPVLNELWLDTLPDLSGNARPTLKFRRRPFPYRESHREWDSLPTHYIPRSAVVSRQVAKGGAAHRYNYWTIDLEAMHTDAYTLANLMASTNDGSGVVDGAPGSMPIYDLNSIARHGLRKYQQSTKYLPYYESDEDVPDGISYKHFLRLWAKWTKLVHDWYVVAPLELSGTIKLASMYPEIRIGERIREEVVDGNVFYYVEGVTNNWSYPAAGTTTLTVTRGEYEDEDLLAYAYEQRERTRPTAQEQCFITEETPENDILGMLAAGCRFKARPSVEEDFVGATVEGSGLDDERYQDALERTPADGEDIPILDDTLEETTPNLDGPTDQAPDDFSPADSPSAPEPDGNPLPQDALERGDAIGLDFDDTDLVAGLDDEELLGP